MSQQPPFSPELFPPEGFFPLHHRQKVEEAPHCVFVPICFTFIKHVVYTAAVGSLQRALRRCDSVKSVCLTGCVLLSHKPTVRWEWSLCRLSGSTPYPHPQPSLEGWRRQASVLRHYIRLGFPMQLNFIFWMELTQHWRKTPSWNDRGQSCLMPDCTWTSLQMKVSLLNCNQSSGFFCTYAVLCPWLWLSGRTKKLAKDRPPSNCLMILKMCTWLLLSHACFPDAWPPSRSSPDSVTCKAKTNREAAGKTVCKAQIFPHLTRWINSLFRPN